MYMGIQFLNEDGTPRRTPYTHPYNYEPFTTWLKASPNKSNGCFYSDRLYQWDHEKYNRLCIKHFGDQAQMFDNRHHDAIEAFLREYTGKNDLELIEIEQQCNQASGFPLWCFKYHLPPTKE